MTARLLFSRAPSLQRQAFCSQASEHGPMQVGLQRKSVPQDLAQGTHRDMNTRWRHKALQSGPNAPKHLFRRTGRPQLAAAAAGAGGDSGSGSSGTGGGGSGGSGGNNGGSSGGDHPMRGWTLLFSFLLFVGGLAGYFKRGSTKSLMASTAIATLLLITTTLAGHLIGTWLALGTTTLLGGYMGLRAARSKKLFPSGLVSVLSLLMSAGYVWTLLG